MKARLITNGILSIVSSVLIIIFIVITVRTIGNLVNNINQGSSQQQAINNIQKSLGVSLGFLAFMWITGITSLVMGIVTLAMEKSENARGLTIASGIIAILGGLFFVGAIVSFIGAYKA